jgi:hypothetical protein
MMILSRMIPTDRAGVVLVLGFCVKFTLPRGTGVATSPPSDSLELAVDRAANLESGTKVTILGVVGPDGYAVLDREEYIRLLREKSGRQ